MGVQVITTVTVPADSYDLVNLSDVKTELLLTETNDDDWLSDVIARTSAKIMQYCNRPFQVETIKDLVYFQMDPYPYQVPGGTVNLQLSRYPVTAVSSVTVLDPNTNSQTLTSGTDFQINANNGQLLRISAFTGFPITWDAAPTQVVYQAGWAAIPDDVRDACISLVKMKWFARTRDPLMKSADNNGVGTKSFWVGSLGLGMMPPDIQDLLDNYRVDVVS